MSRRIAALAIVVALIVLAAPVAAQDEERHYVYLPSVRFEPTPTTTPHWFDAACEGKQRRELIVNGGFEDNEDGSPWANLTTDLYLNPNYRIFRMATVHAFVQSGIVRSGRHAMAVPPLKERDAESVYVNGAPFLMYSDPGDPGPQVAAARLSYWWYYQTSQPDSYESDKIEQTLIECARRDGVVRYTSDAIYVGYDRVNRPDTNAWHHRERDVTKFIRDNNPSWRRCLMMYTSSDDDGEPAAFYFDDVSLEVCE